MKTINVVTIGAAGIFAVAAAALGRMDATASTYGTSAAAAVDATGNLHVPADYRAKYEFLGSRAVAASQGRGSKELHLVYASPGTIAAHRNQGRFPDGSVLVKEVFQAATRGLNPRADA